MFNQKFMFHIRVLLTVNLIVTICWVVWELAQVQYEKYMNVIKNQTSVKKKNTCACKVKKNLKKLKTETLKVKNCVVYW